MISATSFASAVSYISDLIEKGKRLEVKGRELAARREEPIGREDEDWVCDLYRWHDYLYFEAGSSEGPLFTEEEVDVIYHLRGISSDLCDDAYYVVKRSELFGDCPRKTPIYEIVESYGYFEKITQHLESYNDLQKALTGKSGIWLLNRVPQEEYSWSAFINDLDSCFHQFLNWFTRKFGLLVEVAPRVYVSSKSFPIAVECAKIWRSSVDKYHEWSIYDHTDYDLLSALVFENKAEFRVGTLIGHAAHVEFYPLYARAEYYDTDEKVHRAFMKLAERYGCKVAEHREYEVTVVDIPRVVLVDFFRGVLPFVTSMDYRLRYPCDYWCKAFRDEYEVLSKHITDPLSLERELCVIAYERLKRGEGA